MACFAHEADALSLPAAARGGALGKALGRLLKQDGFKGKRREVLIWNAAGRFKAARYLVAGLGRRAALSPEMIREAAGVATRRAVALKAKRIALLLPAPTDGVPAAEIAAAAAEGVALGSYRMTKYLTAEDETGLSLVHADLIVAQEHLSAARSGLARGRTRAEATNLARDIVNEPAMAVTPSSMARVAKEIAFQKKLGIQVLEKKDLAARGMGAILGVAAGSHQPPCVIHLTWIPPKGNRPAPRLALVGKGLTFDSGGLSLKTATGMETMKLDKAGATAVLAVMSAVAELKPPVEVHGIMGMTENMPGGSAIKPGDVLRTMGGKTIEVLNTDAEGRLVLADCLGYAQTLKPDQIIDIATLTGACLVALGPTAAGLFGTDQDMVDALLAAAGRAGEKMWQLPLYDDYADQIRSEIADVKNTGNRYGGAITAALFLKHFVHKDVPWAHLDIAGPAFNETDQAYLRKGATGAMVRTLLTYIDDLARA